MAGDLLISAPDFGLNALLPINMLNPREAADGSYNLIYEKGSLRTAFGGASYHTGTALNSGDPVLHVFTCRILSTDYIIAVTRQKIYRYNVVTETWNDITQSGLTMSSGLDNPISWAVVSHDDTTIYYNDDSAQTRAYEHLIVSDGGLSNIQRWAGEGETDCADLSGSAGYSGAGPHRAVQVGTCQNRLLLISPLEYDVSSRSWIENNVRIRYPMIAKLETWTGTGSGAKDLRDTGGINVWSAALGSEYYIYQDNSIWNLRYVGGTAIFDPRPVVFNLGLLSHHLLVCYSNIHYFIGSDYNVYAFFGGTQKLAIGDKIKDFLYRDLETGHVRRCWMALDVNAERVWIFIVPDGGTYITKAYGYSIRDKAWSFLDLSVKFNSTTGITVASQVAATSSIRGETYGQALTKLSPYDISEAADATLRYGDELCDTSGTLTSEVTNATWCAGGTYLSCATGAFLTDMTPGDIVQVADGSLYTNTRYGTHYYSISEVTNGYILLNERDASCGITPDATKTPAGVPFTVWTDTGPAYSEYIDIYKTKDSLVVGTNSGYLFYFDDSLSGDFDGTKIPARHQTPIFDGGMPGKMKLWPGVRVTARKKETTKDGQILVYYRMSGFDASTGWVRCDTTWSPDSTWSTKTFFINRTSSKIQFGLMDSSGSTFQVSEIEILSPSIQENR